MRNKMKTMIGGSASFFFLEQAKKCQIFTILTFHYHTTKEQQQQQQQKLQLHFLFFFKQSKMLRDSNFWN